MSHFHTIAVAVTVTLHLALGGFMWKADDWFGSSDESCAALRERAARSGGMLIAADADKLANCDKDNKFDTQKVRMIAATIKMGRKDGAKTKQPKKRVRRTKEARTASDTAPSKPSKPEDPKNWQNFKRSAPGEDNPDLEAATDAHTFDHGKEHGTADVDMGDPYLAELAECVAISIPTLERGKGVATVYLQVLVNGTVKAARLSKSGNTNIDQAAELAMRRCKKARKQASQVKPVPKELLWITEKWLPIEVGQ